MQVQKALQQLGYPASQVRIYLASLKIGEATVAEISESVGMPRTTVAELLVEMNKHGLVGFYTRKGRKYWAAENPDKLMSMLKERETVLQNVLPHLRAMQKESDLAKPTVRCYLGLEEVKSIFDDMISTKHNIMSVVSWDDFKEILGDDFADELIERRYSHFLKMRLITPKTVNAVGLKKMDGQQLRQTRFLPEGVNLRRTSTFIYADKVILISLNSKQPTGILIHDSDLAYAQSIFFESLWRHSSEQ